MQYKTRELKAVKWHQISGGPVSIEDKFSMQYLNENLIMIIYYHMETHWNWLRSFDH